MSAIAVCTGCGWRSPRTSRRLAVAASALHRCALQEPQADPWLQKALPDVPPAPEIVRRGESPATAQGLPLLMRDSQAAACAPLWRIFDEERQHPLVRRQAAALCTRCGLAACCPARVSLPRSAAMAS